MNQGSKKIKLAFLAACVVLSLLLPLASLCQSPIPATGNSAGGMASTADNRNASMDMGTVPFALGAGQYLLKAMPAAGFSSQSGAHQQNAAGLAAGGATLSGISLRHALQTAQVRPGSARHDAPASCRAPPAISSRF